MAASHALGTQTTAQNSLPADFTTPDGTKWRNLATVEVTGDTVTVRFEIENTSTTSSATAIAFTDNLDVIGPALTRVLVTGDVVDEHYVRETVRAALAGLVTILKTP